VQVTLCVVTCPPTQVSCARSKDCPIVYASDGFYSLTGCVS